MTKSKRVFAVFLALILSFSVFSVTAVADTNETTTEAVEESTFPSFIGGFLSPIQWWVDYIRNFLTSIVEAIREYVDTYFGGEPPTTTEPTTEEPTTMPDDALVVEPGTNLQAAIDEAQEGDFIWLLAGEYFIDDNENQFGINKEITLTGETGVIINVSGGISSSISASGVIIDGITFYKTDSTNQDIFQIAANGITIRNCSFEGQYVLGGGEVTRAFMLNSGRQAFTFENNTVSGLRQPGYVNGGCSASIVNNTVSDTRGFVICSNSSAVLTGNSFSNNAVDIVIIYNNSPYDNYTDVASISAENNGAFVENQVASLSAINGELI